MGVLTELLKLGMKTAVKQADEVVPRAVSKVDDQLLDMKYTRETPKKKGAFSSIGLAAEGKITDQEAIGGLFNPYTFKNNKMIIGPDASNLNTSRIEISTFPPPGEKIPGFGMKTADDVGLPASEVGNRIDDDAIEVQTNLIEGSKWKWEGELNEGFEKFKDNTYLVSMKGGSKLKKASGGPTGHSYTTKVIYEKGGNLSTYDTRAEYVKELHKSIPESLAALKIKIPKEVEKLTKELKAKGKSAEEIKKEVDALKKKLTRDYKGDNPKGKPTTIGIPEFGTKIGDIKKGGIIQPVYDQIIMREEGGQVLPVIEKNIGGQVLEGLDGEYMRQRNSKEKLEGMMGIPQIQPRQYGGGLDDAYMNRRSAFAPPDVNSAFASPMSQGGLPTIYREDGGTTIPKERMINDQPHQLSYINPEEAGLLQALGGSGRKVDGIPSYFYGDDGTGSDYGEGDSAAADTEADQADADAGAAGRATGEEEPNYETIGYVGEGQTAAFSEAASRAADRENAARFADIGLDMQQKFGGDAGNRLINYGGRRGDVSAMPQGAYSMLWSIPGMTMDKINNMTPQTLEGFSRAFSGKASLDGSTGYRFGGPAGTLQDLLEQEAGRDFNYDDLLENDKKKKKDATEQEREGQELSTAERVANGVQGFYDNISNLLSVKSDLDPSTLSNIEARAKEQGLTYTPSSNVIGTIMNFALPSAVKGGLSALGFGKTIGTVTNEKTGLSFNLNDKGKMTMIEDSTFDAEDTTGSDNDSIARQPRPVQQKTVSTAEDKPLTGMAALYANKNKPVSRKASNKYLEDLLASIYPDPTNRPTLG